MKNVSKLQKSGYKGIKVTSMLKAIESAEMFPRLRLVQQNEFCKIRNKYNKLGYLTKPYFSYLWELYWNFILNDFQFEDKSTTWTIVSKIKNVPEEHIGMKMLKQIIT